MTDNELIAKFGGLIPSGFIRGDDLDPRYKKGEFVQTGWYDPRQNLPDIERFNFGRELHRDELKYHKSWDWLMPIVKKIYILWEEEAGEKDWEHYQEVLLIVISSSIEFVYEAVVKFINWYNGQKEIKNISNQ